MKIVIFSLFLLVGLLVCLVLFNSSQLIHDNAIEVWNLYDGNNTSVIGIFTLFGTILTAFVFFVTAKATKNASDSVRLARESLSLSETNNKKDEFLKRFSMLLEQHNNHLEIVKEYLDKKTAFTPLIMKSTEHYKTFNELRGHEVISPYMRVLYHLLKHIDLEFYIDEKSDLEFKERRKFSSLVRSLIRNDVLSLIAVNSSYIFENGEYNQYKDYQVLLKKFDFFQHVNFFSTIAHNDNDDINALELEYTTMHDEIIQEYTRYNENFRILNSNKKTLGADCIENTTIDTNIDMKIRICVITAIIFNNKTNKLAKKLYINLMSSLNKDLASCDDEFIEKNKKSIFVNKFLDCRIGAMPHISNLLLFEKDKWKYLQRSVEKFNSMKLNSVILTKAKINLLYYSHATSIKILENNNFIFKDNNDDFFISHDDFISQLNTSIYYAKIIYSIKNGIYNKYKSFIIDKYNKKLNSILSQSILLNDETTS